MSSNNSLLPKEAVALVQHIELNKAGWWEKTVHRLVLAVVWLSDGPASASAIQTSLKENCGLSLNMPKLMSVLASLESRKFVLRLSSDAFRIPDTQRAVFEAEIAASEKAENEAKASFCKLVTDIGEDLDGEKVWVEFERQFLGPLIKQVGANAYRLVAGEKMTVDQNLVDDFLRSFSPALHPKMRNLVTTFIDPKKPEVRAHISRMLHAQFCVEASGLSEEVLGKLNASVGKHIRFRMFVDTNFLFSLLELHENPSNAAAQELRELINQLKGNPQIDLVVTPDTIDEAKGSIAYTKGQLKGLPVGRNFTQAALQYGFSGMAVKFLTERLRQKGNLTADEWFDPYLEDFVPIAKSKGVVLFNSKLEGYSTRQDVVDDIHAVFEYEERLPEHRRKSYPKVSHDMVLWHFVNDKRAAYVESPVDAEYWILTVDFRLIGFDEHKQKHSKSKVPLCIHPTSLIQLLQFWVPRTKEFEEAMLGSLRLPFLFQDFDVDGEKTSLKILKGIGRFEENASIPQEAITQVMLNDGLRSRLKTDQSDEVEIALIRDALVDEMRLRAEADANRAKTLQEEVLRRDSAIAALADQKIAAERESARARLQKVEAEALASQQLSSREAELDAVKSRLLAMEEAALVRAKHEDQEQARGEKRKAVYTYVVFLIIVICISAVSAWQATLVFPWLAKTIGSIATRGVASIFVFLLGHLILESTIGRRPMISLLWPFRTVKRFSNFVWIVVVLGFGFGVGGNLYANWIQKNIDADQSDSRSQELKTLEPATQIMEKK